MAKIIWTATALSDLDSIAEYISADSIFYAKQFVQKILLAADKLEKHPELGKVVPELPQHNYREILFKRYRIIYRSEANVVYIISVHHSARLLGNNEHFKNLFE